MLLFVSETCVFAYLGMAIFSFKHQFRPAFVIWTIVSMILCIHFVLFILLHLLIYRGDMNNNSIILFDCWEFRVMPTKDCVSIIASVMVWTSWQCFLLQFIGESWLRYSAFESNGQ